MPVTPCLRCNRKRRAVPDYLKAILPQALKEQGADQWCSRCLRSLTATKLLQ